jgi:hypothetical protein
VQRCAAVAFGGAVADEGEAGGHVPGEDAEVLAGMIGSQPSSTWSALRA